MMDAEKRKEKDDEAEEKDEEKNEDAQDVTPTELPNPPEVTTNRTNWEEGSATLPALLQNPSDKHTVVRQHCAL